MSKISLTFEKSVREEGCSVEGQTIPKQSEPEAIFVFGKVPDFHTPNFALINPSTNPSV